MDPNQELDAAVAQTPAASEPVSQRDDVHNDVAAAIAQLKTKAESAKEQEALADDHPEPLAKQDHPTDPNRYADGTYKKTKAEAAPETVEAPAPKITAPDAAPKPIVQPSTAGDAPGPWAADAKAEWSKLPPAVQAAVMKREAEMNDGGRQWSEQKRQYEAALSPIANLARTRGIPVEAAAQRLAAAQEFLERDAAAGIAWLAQSYGVDLQNLASNPPAPQSQPQYDPAYQQLVQTVQALQSQVNGFYTDSNRAAIETFAKGKDHFEAVRERMSQIVQMMPEGPLHEMLEKAYEQAIWSDPDIRAKLIAEQTAQAQQQQSDALKAKAAQAQKAAVSIKGSSNGASAPKVSPEIANESVYDTVRRSINQLRQQ